MTRGALHQHGHSLKTHKINSFNSVKQIERKTTAIQLILL